MTEGFDGNAAEPQIDSLLPRKTRVLQRPLAPDSYASIFCAISEHLRARPSVVAKQTEVSLWKRRGLDLSDI